LQSAVAILHHGFSAANHGFAVADFCRYDGTGGFKRKGFVYGTQKVKALHFSIVGSGCFKPAEVFAMLRKKGDRYFVLQAVLHDRCGEGDVAENHNLFDAANNHFVNDRPILFNTEPLPILAHKAPLLLQIERIEKGGVEFFQCLPFLFLSLFVLPGDLFKKFVNIQLLFIEAFEQFFAELCLQKLLLGEFDFFALIGFEFKLRCFAGHGFGVSGKGVHALFAESEFAELVIPLFRVHFGGNHQRSDKEVAEIFESFGKGGNAGFIAVQFKLQLSKRAFRELEGSFGFGTGFTEYKIVVGKTNQFESLLFHCFIKPVKIEVRQCR